MLTNLEELVYPSQIYCKEMQQYPDFRTVEDYIKRIKQKLNVKSRSEFHVAMEKVNLWRNLL